MILLTRTVHRNLSAVRALILATASAETLAWIAAVEAADGQQLEPGILAARVNLANWRIPLGGACVFTPGARTLAGALVPMVGPAPTARNFVGGDYVNRRFLDFTGTKDILTNLANNAGGMLQNSRHLHMGLAENWIPAGSKYAIASAIDDTGSVSRDAIRSSTSGDSLATSCASPRTFYTLPVNNTVPAGGLGIFRNSGTEYQVMIGSALIPTVTRDSFPLEGTVLTVGSRQANNFADIKISYYSLGAFVDPTTLNTNFATAVAAITAALP